MRYKNSFIALLFFLFLQGWIQWEIKQHPNTVKCGKLIDIVKHETKHKYTVTYRTAFVVLYDDGKYDSVFPTLEDKYTKKVNDRVCYEQYNHRGWSFLSLVCIVFGIIVLIILTIQSYFK